MASVVEMELQVNCVECLWLLQEQLVVAGVISATGAAGASGGHAANNAGKASGVDGATTGNVDVSSLTASGCVHGCDHMHICTVLHL